MLTVTASRRLERFLPRRRDLERDDRVRSLQWQASVGCALGVLPPDFADHVSALAKRHQIGFALPSRVRGIDAHPEALRLFFEFVSLEAEFTEPELGELVRALDIEGQRESMTFNVHITTYFEKPDRPTYTPALIRDALAGSEKIDDDTAAACVEVMAQLLAFEQDALSFERTVADLPHTSGLVKKRLAAVHRAAAAITQEKGSPEPQAMAHA